MTNLERFFGFRIEFDRFLNPHTLRYLREEAHTIASLKGFDINDFYVYVHNIYILEGRDQRGRIPLGDKLDKLTVEFKVNPKQARSNLIQFFNSNVEDLKGRETGVEKAYTEKLVLMSYDNTYLTENTAFKTRLITYISKDLVRSKFQKIKVQVTATPTSRFQQTHLSKHGRPVITQMDMHFHREVQLRIQFDEAVDALSEDNWEALDSDLVKLREELSKAPTLAIARQDVERVDAVADSIARRDSKSLYRHAVNFSVHTVQFCRDVGVNVLANVLSR